MGRAICAAGARRARVLDLAAGGGRHTRLFLERGHPVTAVDRDIGALGGLQEREGARLEAIGANLEDGTPWPLAGRRFGGIVVVNYLWRPLFGAILDALDDGGVLIYATFMAGQERHGRPTRPDFLLRPHELLEVVRGRLQVIAFAQGAVDRGSPGQPRVAVRQRICAARSRPFFS